MIVAGHGGAEAAQAAVVVSRRTFAGYWEYLPEDAIFTAPPCPAWRGGALIASDVGRDELSPHRIAGAENEKG